MEEKDLQDWAYEDDERMGLPAKIASVALLVIIGLVALSMIPGERDPVWQVIYGGVGIGSIVFGIKATRE